LQRPAFLLAILLGAPAGAWARCAPPQDRAILAAGGAIVSGRILEVGGTTPGAGVPGWARLEVTARHAGEAPAMVRLRAAAAGLYTPAFRVGDTVTFILRAPSEESSVTLCDRRDPPPGRQGGAPG
jgi:hypothetical protein